MDQLQNESSRVDSSDKVERPWQFGLPGLFVLMTVVAAIAVLSRYAAGDPFLQVALIAYLVLILLFLGLRSLFLMNVWFGSRHVREDRRQLARWVQSKRDAQRRDEVSREQS